MTNAYFATSKRRVLLHIIHQLKNNSESFVILNHIKWNMAPAMDIRTHIYCLHILSL